MSTITEIKRLSRAALHDFMGRPASYYADPSAVEPTWLGTKARYHSIAERAGDLAGTNLSYAETQDRRETVVFWREHVNSPPRNALVIFSADEGYHVNNTLPPDGLTVTTEVVRATTSELLGFLLPDGETVITA